MVQTPLPFAMEHAYLEDLASFAALREAMQSGLIDLLAQAPGTVGGLAAALGRDAGGMFLLLDLLARARVVHRNEEDWSLTGPFATVLQTRRAVMTAKMDFLSDAVMDVALHLPALLFDMESFQAASRTFGLFRYDKAMDVSPDALAVTARWVDYVTALSIDEAPMLAPHIDLAGCRRLLEIGGNTGVMSETLLDTWPDLTAVVMDLPAVCALASERMSGRASAARLRFVPGDARLTDWPGPVDAVLFKSVLHDWPDDDVKTFFRMASDRLVEGGRVILCERLPVSSFSGPLPLWMMANLVFAPFYRETENYRRLAAAEDLKIVAIQRVDLEMPFQLVTLSRQSFGADGQGQMPQ